METDKIKLINFLRLLMISGQKLDKTEDVEVLAVAFDEAVDMGYG